MAVNVVKLANGETVIDLSDATITEDTVLEGYIGYGANGEPIVGKAASTKHFALNITLKADGWEDNEQTVMVPGVLADPEKCTVFAGPDISSDPEYGNSDIWCSAQKDDALTFGCVFVPDTDITVNVTVFASGGSAALSGYTRLNYIESSGGQYIDTGISGGMNAAYEIKFSSCGNVASDWNHYFAGDGQDTSAARIQAMASVQVVGYWYNSAHYYHLWNMDDAEVHTVRYDSTGSMYVDGTEASYGADTGGFAGNGWGSLSWYVFNSHNEPGTMAKMKLYSLKMYTDGVLVRDFVPMKRDSDGAIGLYDLVSAAFFTNVGTGAFTGA